MRYALDLHLHSRFARATSKDLNVASLATWGKMKGVDVVGTGDATHPIWLAELERDLVESASGLYKSKDHPDGPYFTLTVEISTIWKQGERVRRMHTVFVFSSLAATKKVADILRARGANLHSDGRPTIGMSQIDLADLVWEADPLAIIIPAHIWTPWFSMFGSKSGFDSVAECFGPLASRIKIIETGLSSDPPMNWRIKELDSRTIVSFSDAHSPGNLAREYTIIEMGEPTFAAMKEALEGGKVIETVEFFPEEGKYHYDGHAPCGVRLRPIETKRLKGRCPNCGRPITVGVLSRVEELADAARPEGYQPSNRPPYRSLVPLPEALGAAIGVGKSSKQVQALYTELVQKLDSERKILIDSPLDEIERAGGEVARRAVEDVRAGNLTIEPGYDGIYGTVTLKTNASTASTQPTLFSG